VLAKVERNREASTDAEYAQKSARIARDDAAKELKRVEHVGSALPEFALAMRDHICAEVGADATELPYIAELLDLKPDQTRWRLAVEKVLRGAGLRLLVPDQHWEKVLRFVNDTDMRGRLQLHHVRAKLLGAEPVRSRTEHFGGQAVRRRSEHPCAAEAVDVFTNAGDHVCVDTPDVFARFRRAVTDTGLYKDSDRLAVKDDRRPVKQSEYLYQGDVSAKINALPSNWPPPRSLPEGPPLADDIAAQRQQWRDRRGGVQGDLRAVPAVEPDRHRDRRRARRPAARAIRVADGRQPRPRALNARADECWSQIQKFMTRRGAIQTRRDSLDERRTRLLELQERLSPAFVSEPLTELLNRYAAQLPVSPGTARSRTAPRRVVHRDQEGTRTTAESRRRSYDELARILNTFDTSFPDAIPTTAMISMSACTTTSRCASTSTSANCPRPTSG
jgi:hypothetical protein